MAVMASLAAFRTMVLQWGRGGGGGAGEEGRGCLTLVSRLDTTPFTAAWELVAEESRAFRVSVRRRVLQVPLARTVAGFSKSMIGGFP